jgi:hypothetical protein
LWHLAALQLLHHRFVGGGAKEVAELCSSCKNASVMCYNFMPELAAKVVMHACATVGMKANQLLNL